MNDKLKGVLITTGVVASMAVGGAAIAGATSGGGERDDDATDKPIAGDARGKAIAAALKHTGGGNATETEVGDEEGAYEVEVTRANGSQVDVHLNRNFEVTSQADDNDRGGEQDERGDD
jgi:uncharacterized membrane protein YkoI